MDALLLQIEGPPSREFDGAARIRLQSSAICWTRNAQIVGFEAPLLRAQ